MAWFIAQSEPQICCNNDVFGQKSNAVTDRLHQNQGAKQTPDLAAGDGLRLTAQSEGLFAAGLKHVDPRLKSQKQSPSCPWFQSKTEYFPLVISFSSEKEALPYMRALDRELLRIEQENTFDPEVCAVVGICADTPIFIKVVKPEDMKFAQTETEPPDCIM